MAQPGDTLVVGAGVMGLTTALCLAERGLAVRVLASELPPDTTSAVAGALIRLPVTIEPLTAAVDWSRTTLEEFTALAGQPDSGVRVARGRLVSRQGSGPPEWARSMPDFRACEAAEHAGFPVAFWMSSPVVDMPRYLGYLSGRLAARGVRIQTERLDSVQQAATLAPVVVNCSGLGARELAGDQQMRPVRGQHVVVENPGIDDFFYENGKGPDVTTYIPHANRLVLGGTVQPGDSSRQPDPAATEAILLRCAAVEPRIAGARVLSVDVGLRPGRGQIRLEEELVGSTLVIHNYGHGGVGVGMSWGCARDVEQLVVAARR